MDPNHALDRTYPGTSGGRPLCAVSGPVGREQALGLSWNSPQGMPLLVVLIGPARRSDRLALGTGGGYPDHGRRRCDHRADLFGVWDGYVPLLPVLHPAPAGFRGPLPGLLLEDQDGRGRGVSTGARPMGDAWASRADPFRRTLSGRTGDVVACLGPANESVRLQPEWATPQTRRELPSRRPMQTRGSTPSRPIFNLPSGSRSLPPLPSPRYPYVPN